MRAGIIFLLIFCISFQLTAFDRDIYNEKQEKVLNYFYGGELPDMTEQEISHMEDVKQLYNYFTTFIWVLIIIIGFSFFLKPDLKFNIWNPLVIFISILIMIYFFPNFFFELFHKVFFSQGNYLFPSNSVLKTLFPDSFFFNLFHITSIKTIFVTLLLVLIQNNNPFIAKKC